MEEQQNINQEPEVKQVKKKSLGMEIWEWTYSILLAVVIALLIKGFLFSTTIVKGQSMEPTLYENHVLAIDRLSQVRGVMPERGDIITVEEPTATVERIANERQEAYSKNRHYLPKYKGKAEYKEVNGLLNKFKYWFTRRLYVKRVIALPGDHLVIDGDMVYVNDELLDEDYINTYKYYDSTDIDIVVPEGYVFVMGDNRGNSSDSRVLGEIPINKIEGKVLFRIWPFNKFGGVK